MSKFILFKWNKMRVREIQKSMTIHLYGIKFDIMKLYNISR